MTDEFIETLKRARAERNLSQADLARALGVSRAAIGQWERGITTPTFANMQALANLFGFADKLLSENPGRYDHVQPHFWRIMTAKHTFSDEKHNVPVTHICLGSNAKLVRTANKSLDHVFRTPFLLNKNDAYAIAIATDAMSPRFEMGETIYVTPDEEPAIGEYCVLTTVNKETGEEFEALRKYIADIGQTLQFQIMKSREFTAVDRPVVARLHRIVPWNELIELGTDSVASYP